MAAGHLPTHRRGDSRGHRLHLSQNIVLSARGACVGSHRLPSSPHYSTDHEDAGVVADGLTLVSLSFSRNEVTIQDQLL
ncbi:MAG TPA: hypothetical protein VGF67_32220 [Ktedonobacteraceae bacterium]